MAPKKGSVPWNKGLKGIIQPGCGAKKGSVPWNKGLKGVHKAWNRGVPMSDESKKKLSDSCKQHWSDPENRQKLVDSHLGQKAWNEGVPMRQESKMKLAEAKRCKKHSDEHKAKISESLTGDKNPFYGKHHSEATKKKLSIMFSGPNSCRWQGGIACEPYCDAWLDKAFKEDIKARDGYKCQSAVCSGKSKNLCVHHINYQKKDCRPENLITVCVSCNARANAHRARWAVFYQDIVFYNQLLFKDQELLKSISTENPANTNSNILILRRN